MNRWNLGRVYHPKPGQPYHQVNSPRGIMAAAAAGLPWVDLDGNPSKRTAAGRAVTMGTHWPRPLLRDGFVDPLDEIGRNRTTSTMDVEEIRRLRAPGGYQIFKMTTLFAIAADEGVNVLEEMKYHRAFESPALHRAEKHAVEQLQLAHPRFQVIVAILSTHPRAVEVAKAAQAAGRRTCLLAKDDYPKPWQQHFNYVRGKGRAVPIR